MHVDQRSWTRASRATFRIVSQKLKAQKMLSLPARLRAKTQELTLGGGIFTPFHVCSEAWPTIGRSAGQSVEAYRYAYDETLRTTSRARFIQHPTYAYKMKGREDLIITRLAQSHELGRVQLTGSGTWESAIQPVCIGGHNRCAKRCDRSAGYLHP